MKSNAALVIIEQDDESELELSLPRNNNKWERAPEEDSEEYAAFLIYRDLGSLNRSISSAQTIIGNHHFPNLSAIANRNKWKLRADAWDEELVRLRNVATERAIIEMSERHALQIESAASTLMMPINALINRAKNDPGVMETMVGLDTAELVQMMIKSVSVLPRVIQTERLIHGQSTAAQEIKANVTNKNMNINAKLEDLTDEQLNILGDIFGEE